MLPVHLPGTPGGVVDLSCVFLPSASFTSALSGYFYSHDCGTEPFLSVFNTSSSSSPITAGTSAAVSELGAAGDPCAE